MVIEQLPMRPALLFDMESKYSRTPEAETARNYIEHLEVVNNDQGKALDEYNATVLHLEAEIERLKREHKVLEDATLDLASELVDLACEYGFLPPSKKVK